MRSLRDEIVEVPLKPLQFQANIFIYPAVDCGLPPAQESDDGI